MIRDLFRLAVGLTLFAMWASWIVCCPFVMPRAKPQTSDQLALQEREARRYGLTHALPLLKAQITQESHWNPQARSPVGALGLAQFMPLTWTGKPEQGRPGWRFLVKPSCADKEATDEPCALRGQAGYMKSLHAQAGRYGFRGVDAWLVALAGYNGGMGWVKKEQRLCQADPRCNSRRWSRHVATKRARGVAAFRENREYTARITERVLADLLD